MNGRASRREVLVGVVMVVAFVGMLGFLGLAGGGPGFLSTQRTFDVMFRDGQGLREGSAVRVAGIDAGRVVDIDLVESEGTIRARVRIALPTHLAKKLKQDVKVTIQPNLTGQSRVNIVSSGRSNVELNSGQVVQGVESTFFDPILEQVGIGPVERSDISHSIGKLRETIDSASPRLDEILTNFQETAGGIRESADTLRPVIEKTAQNAEVLSKRIAAASPKIDSTLARVESVAVQVDQVLKENSPNIQATLAGARDLTATLSDITTKNRAKIERLIDGAELTRARADRVLYQADVLVGQFVQMMTKNRADIERTVANVRDATDWANKLVQKIFANPFVLSPFYKPTPEDTRVQVVYDTAQVFTKGAQELNDLAKTLDAMRTRPQTPAQQAEIAQIQQNIQAATQRLFKTSELLDAAIQRSSAPSGRSRR